MSKVLLSLVMVFSGLWKAMGADIPQLRAILHARLIVDNRKPISFGNNKGGAHKKKDRKNTIILTMLLSLFMGIIYVLPIMLTAVNTVIGLTLFYAIFTVFFTFTLITDFSNVLIDTKDKYILFSRPVSERTIMMSRLLYIAIYIFRLVIPMSVPAWILFGILKGWVGAVWFPFPLILNVFIVIFLVCGLYILMLRIAGPRKFKDVLNYFQIGFSILFFGTWMMTSRMIDPEAIAKMDLMVFDWVKYIPMYWIASSWSWVDSSAQLFPGTKWMGILAIAFPVVSLWATIKWLTPHFIKTLVASDNSDDPGPARKKLASEKSPAEKTYLRFAHRLNKSDAGKAGFIMTWIQTARNRTFKMRVYPMLAYVPVYFFYILMTSNRSFSDVFEKLPEGYTHIMLLYMTFFVVLQALNYVTMSDQYKAAWVYYSSPVSKPGEIILGAYKAIWVKYFMPFMVFVGAFVIVIWGPLAIFDVLLATVNITLFSMAMTRISYRILPFSKKEQMRDSGLKSILRVLLTFLIIGVLGMTHYAVAGIALPENSDLTLDMSTMFNPWVLNILALSLKMVFILLSSILLWLVHDSLRNSDWQSIQKADSDG